MANNVVLIVRFVPKAGMHQQFKKSLVDLIEMMKAEPAFIDGILHDDVDHRGELVFYETWSGTKEDWVREQAVKVYRQDYERMASDLLERRDIQWLKPISKWTGSATSG